MIKPQGFIVLLIAGVLGSCNPPALVNQTEEVADGHWEFGDIKRFTVDVEDTLQLYNYHILVRHGGNYGYQNLIVYFKTFYPNNTYDIDTINCMMAYPTGEWIGSGLGDLIDNDVLFKINQPLPLPGTYNFEIQHAMRPDTIEEIYDVGILIESAMN